MEVPHSQGIHPLEKATTKKDSGFEWLTERAAFKQAFNKLTSKLLPPAPQGRRNQIH